MQSPVIVHFLSGLYPVAGIHENMRLSQGNYCNTSRAREVRYVFSPLINRSYVFRLVGILADQGALSGYDKLLR